MISAGKSQVTKLSKARSQSSMGFLRIDQRCCIRVCLSQKPVTTIGGGKILKKAKSLCPLLTCFSVCFAAAAAAEEQNAAERVTVFTAHVPPYVAPVGGTDLTSNAVEGLLVPSVTDLLQGLNLRYEMVMLPWSATYRRALATSNALIFPLDRTPERENRFHWIKTLHTSEYFIYGIRGVIDPEITIEDIAALGASVSCTKNSVQCELLSEAGLTPDTILALEGATIPDRYRLMIRNRNLFSVFDPAVFDFLTKKHGLDARKLVRLQKVGERNSYLAVNKSASDTLLDKLGKPTGD